MASEERSYPPPHNSNECPFCRILDADCLVATPLIRAFWDTHPVSPGHVLVATRRHIADWFTASPDEQAALLQGVTAVRDLIEQHQAPDGYNIGANVGVAAGQTVPHLHLHVIPRFAGDVRDPRGGVRYVIPDKANYLAGPVPDGAPHGGALIHGGDDPLLPHLVAHLAHAERVDIAVAFIMASGVRLLIEHLRDVLARGGKVRILAGDYLDVTEPDALRRLLDLGGALELRVFQSVGTSFHLKSYVCINADETGTAFVGSSNVSQTALQAGIEWNYRALTSRDGAGFTAVRAEFERLFDHARAIEVDADWIATYDQRRREQAKRALSGSEIGLEAEVPQRVPEPHAVQREALAALLATRDKGNEAGLIVMATGLGKTWLAAFDSVQAAARRVLFVAHREEILDQAMRTFRAIRPTATLGKYTGTERTVDAEVTFASIQTLGKQLHLSRFAADQFDYVIVDEFHHASAATYRRLLDHFCPKFLLGLTATPDRSDGADLLTLCGENLVYRADLVEGVRRGLLSPFDYYGVPDDVDYAQIPWRSTRFDEEALTAAVATRTRADNALDQLRRRGGSRTIAFCVSQRHAVFMREHFRNAGLRVAAVFSGSGSDPRTRSLEQLQAGELDVLVAVDMFNEGVDIPDVDTIMMLRPTESAILWLQQFGRGLRWRLGKRLKVIDYIGNHRTFLLKPRTLFQLDGGDAQISYALRLLEEGKGAELLPPGCSATYDLEAKDILTALLRPTGEALQAFYADFKQRTGVRPTAAESFHAGYDPKSARRGYGSWFQFIRAMGDLPGTLDAGETRIRELLASLEVTPMSRSFAMVVLLAMLSEDAFPGRVGIQALASRARIIAQRSAVLREEFGAALEDDSALVALLETDAIPALTGIVGAGGQSFFSYADRVLSAAILIPNALHAAAASMTRELVEWRLAVYLRRVATAATADRIICKVSHSDGRPILFLPPRDRVPGIPDGWVDVVVDGAVYQAKFAKIAINVFERPNHAGNVLPDLLRNWYGESAGQPGTTQVVEFARSGGTYVVAPLRGEIEDGPQLWKTYKRADVPALFGGEFKGFESQAGIFERYGLAVFFVTLDKSSKPEAHRYEDAFLSPLEFRWQSQNRTKRDSDAGRRLAEHAARGTKVHLFVRSATKLRGETQPFTYCGELEFERWDGDNPITVWWRMSNPVPERLWKSLRVPVAEP